MNPLGTTNGAAASAKLSDRRSKTMTAPEVPAKSSSDWPYPNLPNLPRVPIEGLTDIAISTLRGWAFTFARDAQLIAIADCKAAPEVTAELPAEVQTELREAFYQAAIVALDEQRNAPVEEMIAEPVAWAFRYRGRFGNVDWTPWGASFGPEKPVIEHAECEARPLVYAHLPVATPASEK